MNRDPQAEASRLVSSRRDWHGAQQSRDKAAVKHIYENRLPARGRSSSQAARSRNEGEAEGQVRREQVGSERRLSPPYEFSC